MSEPAKSGKNTTIIILLVALLLGVPCLLGVLALIGGGLLFFIGSESQQAPVMPAPPIVVPIEREPTP